eukprot:5526399-Amphidinium_carterae.1
MNVHNENVKIDCVVEPALNRNQGRKEGKGGRKEGQSSIEGRKVLGFCFRVAALEHKQVLTKSSIQRARKGFEESG